MSAGIETLLVEPAAPVRDTELGRVVDVWPNLTRLKAEGHDQRPDVRQWIINQAERGMKSAYGTAEGRRNIEYLCALEVACEQWFANHNTP